MGTFRNSIFVINAFVDWQKQREDAIVSTMPLISRVVFLKTIYHVTTNLVRRRNTKEVAVIP
jgi:hypothetical protein